jgi:PrsW family intramembrane metalloprotease
VDPARKTDPLSVLQLALSTLCFFGCLAGGALLALSALDPAARLQANSREAVLTYAWAAGLLALVMALSAYFALRRVAGNPVIARGGGSFTAATIGLLFWPVLIWAGSSAPSTWMPPFQILSLVIPFFWFIQFARRGLPSINPQRAWGLAAVGMTLTPALLILLEFLFGLGVFILAIFRLAGNPETAMRLNELAGKLTANPLNPRILEEAGQILIGLPGFVFLLMTLVAGIIPLLEELVKPIGIWFTSGRANPPALGWTAGLISGAAFAMLEGVGVSANFGGAEWVQVVIQRTGTGLLHITTCALVGWGLASAWEKREYVKLVVAFVAAVVLHSSWNALAVLLGIQPFLGITPGFETTVTRMPAEPLLVIFLFILAVGMIAILAGMNHHLRSSLNIDLHIQSEISETDDHNFGNHQV